jgi:two-component system chemotaxis sensor kinase CheA
VQIDRDAIVDVFLREAEENLSVAEATVNELADQTDDRELIRTLFRIVHGVKGDADALGFQATARIAHELEDLLDDLRKGTRSITGDLLAEIHGGLDALRDAVASIDRSRTRAGAAAEPSTQPIASRATSVRVDIGAVDEALDVSGELYVALSRLTHESASAGPSSERVLDALDRVEQLCRELQDRLIALRMVRIGPMLGGFIRGAREICARAGKQARVVLTGAEVTADANVIERLREPLLHILRNAVDHGVEPPETRLRLGKDPVATLELRARRDLGALVVEVEDDGAGMDRDRLRERGRASGALAGTEEPDDQQLFEIAFQPGYSTVSSVTETSGRGVGLDAVRTTVESLGGTVSLSSKANAGTTVTLRVPIDVTLVDGLEVEAGGERFVVPRDAVVACVDLPATKASSPRGLVDVEGRATPFFHLGSLLGAASRGAERELGVVVESFDRRLAVGVDRMIGETRTVVKPLGPVFRAARCVSGCALLGSGRLALVLHVDGLFAEAQRLENRRHEPLSRGRS